MDINFKTGEVTADEARGLVALLLTVCPRAEVQPLPANDFKPVIWIDDNGKAYGRVSDEQIEVALVGALADVRKRSALDETGNTQADHDAGQTRDTGPDHPDDVVDPADNPATGAPDAAEVFATPARVMLPNANGHTYESLRDAGWTDAQMISAQMMEAPKVTAPLPPSSGAATAPPNTVPTPPPPPSDAASVFAASSTTPAPPVANAAAPADTTGLALDSDDLPWDGRIHASTRTKTAKGAWTKLKKVDPAVYEGVVAELRQAMAIDKAAAHVPLNGTAPPPPPPQSVVVPLPPPPITSGPVTFADVMAYIGTRNFDEATIQRACVQHAVPGVSLLGIMPNKCADVLATLRAIP